MLVKSISLPSFPKLKKCPGIQNSESINQDIKYTYTTTIRIQLQELHAVNPLNAELNPICYLLALLGAHHFLHVSRIRVKSLTLRLIMSYIYI
jgi:hypothetical protein